MNVSHYDKNGKKIGESRQSHNFETDFLATILAVLGLPTLGVILYFMSDIFLWATSNMLNWKSLDMPYNYIFSFYHYVIQIPITFSINNFFILFSKEFTEYPNFNILISIVIVVSILLIIKRVLTIINLNHLFLLLLLPAFLGGILFTSIEIYGWITITK